MRDRPESHILTRYSVFTIAIGEPVIGEGCFIGRFTLLDASGGLTIGANCSISDGVKIYTHDSVAKRVSEGEQGCEYSPVTIGDWVYIGPNTVVAKGVSIGSHAIIGAHSFVNTDIPANTKAWGCPAKEVK